MFYRPAVHRSESCWVFPRFFWSIWPDFSTLLTPLLHLGVWIFPPRVTFAAGISHIWARAIHNLCSCCCEQFQATTFTLLLLLLTICSSISVLFVVLNCQLLLEDVCFHSFLFLMLSRCYSLFQLFFLFLLWDGGDYLWESLSLSAALCVLLFIFWSLFCTC